MLALSNKVDATLSIYLTYMYLEGGGGGVLALSNKMDATLSIYLTYMYLRGEGGC